MFNDSYSLVKKSISLQYYINEIRVFLFISTFIHNVVQTINHVHVTKFDM